MKMVSNIGRKGFNMFWTPRRFNIFCQPSIVQPSLNFRLDCVADEEEWNLKFAFSYLRLIFTERKMMLLNLCYF